MKNKSTTPTPTPPPPPPSTRKVQWTMPEWAADTLMETLSLDTESSAFDHELREEISKALETVQQKTL